MYLGPLVRTPEGLRPTCAWPGCGRTETRFLHLSPPRRVTRAEDLATTVLLCPEHEAAAQKTCGLDEARLAAWRATTLRRGAGTGAQAGRVTEHDQEVQARPIDWTDYWTAESLDGPWVHATGPEQAQTYVRWLAATLEGPGE